MYPIIIDANVWIRYARAKNIAPLIDRFVAYNFFPVADNYLLSEIFKALVDNKWMVNKQATFRHRFYQEDSFCRNRTGCLQD